MILATDLRIGNLVKRKSGNYTPVLAIYSDSIHVECEPPLKSLKGMTIPLRTVSGIEVTPEILVSIGFELYPWGWVKLADSGFGFRINVFSFSYDVSGNNPIGIKFLHELQNLFFASTKEELPTHLIDPINKYHK